MGDVIVGPYYFDSVKMEAVSTSKTLVTPVILQNMITEKSTTQIIITMETSNVVNGRGQCKIQAYFGGLYYNGT
jgi:hypothetical protein